MRCLLISEPKTSVDKIDPRQNVTQGQRKLGSLLKHVNRNVNEHFSQLDLQCEIRARLPATH